MTSSQVLCGPEICCKSLADFFLIRNIPKECDSCSLIFPVPIGKYAVHFLQEFFSKYALKCSCAHAPAMISSERRLTMPPNVKSLDSLAARLREKCKRGFQAGRNLKKLVMSEEACIFLRHKFPHLNTTTVCVAYSHGCSLFCQYYHWTTF
jgi:hypothetical protein